jgi:hypothetical protein
MAENCMSGEKLSEYLVDFRVGGCPGYVFSLIPWISIRSSRK